MAAHRADILQSQTQQLESEARALRDELAASKVQIQKLTRDNQELQQEVGHRSYRPQSSWYTSS